MKAALQLILTALLISSSIEAEEEHHHKIIPGPHGGKILESSPLHLEFYVQADKKVLVTFYDKAMKPIAPQSQVIKAIVEAKSEKTPLEFEKNGESFLSKEPLPAGNGYRIVIQIKNDPSAKPQNFRLDYHDELCGECKRAEYACTCEHAESGDHSEHKH